MARILVVDDNRALCEAMCETLQQAGYATVGTPSGRLAARIHRSNPVDLLVTDLFMPDIDGFELLRLFRRNFPSVKIIVVSGGGSRGMMEMLSAASKMGAEQVLQKPFQPGDLLKAVEAVLGTGPETPSAGAKDREAAPDEM